MLIHFMKHNLLPVNTLERTFLELAPILADLSWTLSLSPSAFPTAPHTPYAHQGHLRGSPSRNIYPSTWFHPQQPRRDRHGLSVQHVRAIGIQIQAKVIETGYQVDVNGSCWASRPEIHRPTPRENGCSEQTRQYGRHQKLTQEEGQGQNTERWRKNLGGGDTPSGAAGHKTDNGNVNNGDSKDASQSGSRERPQSTRMRSMHNEEWENEDRRRSLRGRQRNQRRRRRSWQASHTSEEDGHHRCSPATDEHDLLTSPPAGTEHTYSQNNRQSTPRLQYTVDDDVS